MAVYYITGGLGDGKTLITVKKIEDYLRQGRRVVTNLDLWVEHFEGDEKARLVQRIPDKPEIEDLKMIGYGYDHEDPKHYDPNKFGALVLDELGTWFNSRDWQQKGRREVINWLLQARKYRWDLYFIIQDLDLLDKQASSSTAKSAMVVRCKAMGKYSIPVVSTFTKLLGLGPVKLPDFHLGIVRVGKEFNAPVADRWPYRGKRLWQAYNTRQEFLEREYSDQWGVSTYLSKWDIEGRYRIPFTLERLEEMARDNSHIGVFGAIAAVLIGFVAIGLSIFIQPTDTGLKNAVLTLSQSINEQKRVEQQVNEPVMECQSFDQEFMAWRVLGSISLEHGMDYWLEDATGWKVSTAALRDEGITPLARGSHAVILRSEEGCTVKLTQRKVHVKKKESDKSKVEKAMAEVKTHQSEKEDEGIVSQAVGGLF